MFDMFSPDFTTYPQYNMLIVFCNLSLKCISIVPEDIEYIELHRNDWYCSCCLVDLFPFNNLENETDSPASGSLRYLSDKMFLPFELNDSDHQFGNDSIDPDLNYFRSFNHCFSCCNYFVESSFNSEIEKCLSMKQHFSMSHLIIRSLRKNVCSFEILLDGLEHKFSLLGVTETCLKDDDCDLYDIEGYNKLEKHRQKILSLELFLEFQIQIWRTLMKRWQMHWNNWKINWCS